MLLRSLAMSASVTALLAVETAVGGSAAMAAANITIQAATIQTGRLVIVGIAAAPGTVVRIAGTTFQATANAQSQFVFNIIYRTPNCIVVLLTNMDRQRAHRQMRAWFCVAPAVGYRPCNINPAISSSTPDPHGSHFASTSTPRLRDRPRISTGRFSRHVARPVRRVSPARPDRKAHRVRKGREVSPGTVPGPQGVPGQDGQDGEDGPTGEDGESGIFAGATIVAKTCTDEESYDYEDSYNGVPHCIAACPEDKAAVTGWSRNPFSEGAHPRRWRIRSSKMACSYGAAFQDRYLVVEGASDEIAGTKDVTVAIMCLPTVDNPVPHRKTSPNGSLPPRHT